MQKNLRNLCTQEANSSNLNASGPAKPEINEDKFSNKETVPDINQSYVIKKGIMKTAYRTSSGKTRIGIESLAVLESWPDDKTEIKPPEKVLNSEILHMMAGEDLILLSNGKITLTGKELEEPDNQEDSKEIHYIILSILEDVNVPADGELDYHVRWEDLIHFPEVNANLLITRAWTKM